MTKINNYRKTTCLILIGLFGSFCFQGSPASAQSLKDLIKNTAKDMINNASPIRKGHNVQSVNWKVVGGGPPLAQSAIPMQKLYPSNDKTDIDFYLLPGMEKSAWAPYNPKNLQKQWSN